MIYEWDEVLSENSIKGRRSNNLYSLFLKISDGVLQSGLHESGDSEWNQPI